MTLNQWARLNLSCLQIVDTHEQTGVHVVFLLHIRRAVPTILRLPAYEARLHGHCCQDFLWYGSPADPTCITLSNTDVRNGEMAA